MACLVLAGCLFLMPSPAMGAEVAAGDTLMASGTITNSHGKGIAAAVILTVISDFSKPLTYRTDSDDQGRYYFELRLNPRILAKAKTRLEVRKPSYAPSDRLPLNLLKFAGSGSPMTLYVGNLDVTLQRTVSPALWIAGGVLVMIYILIGFDMVHRTLAALLGAALLLGITYLAGSFWPEFKIISFEDAARAIDMNVILLLLSMMIIVGITEKSGLFQWLAYKCYRMARGRVMLLAAILMAVTAFISAFLDNVTTILLVVPVTLQIAATLKIDPITLLLPEVFASNLGGAATLIGDPPNIMIGSYAKLTFMDFIRNLTLPCLLTLAFCIAFYLFYFRREYRSSGPQPPQPATLAAAEEFKIVNRRLLWLSLIVLTFTIVLFMLHGLLEMAPCIAALIGATALLIVSREKIVDVLSTEIEWPTLIFFACLFIIVAAAEESGLIHMIADTVRAMSQGSQVTAILLIIWVSAIASAFIDNIPFAATMLPVVAYLSESLPGSEGGVLWWALALGACLGGNGTLIGASANVVAVGIAEQAGIRISFKYYFKVCFFPMLISVAVCCLWLLLVGA